MNSFKLFFAALPALAVAPFLCGQEVLPEEVLEEGIVVAEEGGAKAESASAGDKMNAGNAFSENTVADSSGKTFEEKKPELPPEPQLTPQQRTQLEIRLISARKARVDAELGLEKARLAAALAPRNAERKRLETETGLRVARSSAKLAEMDEEKRKLDAIYARDKARDDLALLERGNALRVADIDLKIARAKQDLDLARQSQRIAQVKMAEQTRDLAVPAVFEQKEYRKDPLVDGKLYITDRRIELSGVVTPELAKYVIEKIYFHNNQGSEYPIFLVIDNSPGGSVSAGYQIIKAMESSKAPVYVVVKSFAASMAAMITSYAERSFCYKDSVIMHHQPSSQSRGNLTQMGEQLKLITNWTRYINDKLAAKMGLSYEQYVAEMYKHNSEGDWSEFGDGALKWKWVTDVVETIDEAGFVRKEKTKPQQTPPNVIIRQYQIDEQGKPYLELPTLPAGDAWMIYDPHKRYRVGA